MAASPGVRRALALAAVAAITVLAAACGGGGLGDGGAGAGTTPAAGREAAPAFRRSGAGAGSRSPTTAASPWRSTFWASWCGPCREEMPALVAFAEANPGLRVVGLAVNDREEESRRFARDLGVDFDLGVDRDGDVAASYGATGLPITREDLDLFTRGLGA